MVKSEIHIICSNVTVSLRMNSIIIAIEFYIAKTKNIEFKYPSNWILKEKKY